MSLAKGGLDANSDVRSQSGERIGVRELLGHGGQGEVYRAEYCGQEFALKWFHDRVATNVQRECIAKLIRQGKPSENFLWPLEMATMRGSASFGYLMNLREGRYACFDSIVTGKKDPSFFVLLTVGLNLVESFHDLHTKGLCYRDINFGNGFFDADNGDVVICDNDNVADNDSILDTVLGTPDFMAPEIVLRKARPNRETDYFSLSVLLFYIFHIQHPLIGKKILSIRSWDLPAREKLFGLEPVFIFDPADRSNEAIDDRSADPLGEAGKNAIRYWEDIYPSALKDAFVHSFTTGCRNPQKRLHGTQWSDVLAQARESIYRCEFCSKENFFDSNKPRQVCWSCRRIIQPALFLKASGKKRPLAISSRLYEYQLKGERFDRESPIVGEVVPHPSLKGVIGMQNKSAMSWSVTLGDGKCIEVIPGKSIPLSGDAEFRIGNYRANVEKA